MCNIRGILYVIKANVIRFQMDDDSDIDYSGDYEFGGGLSGRSSSVSFAANNLETLADDIDEITEAIEDAFEGVDDIEVDF